MSDEKKIDTAKAGGSESRGLDEKTIGRLAAEMEAELEDLYESRRRRAAERAKMTEEEQIAAMVADLEAVLADAEACGMDIITIPEDSEEEE